MHVTYTTRGSAQIAGLKSVPVHQAYYHGPQAIDVLEDEATRKSYDAALLEWEAATPTGLHDDGCFGCGACNPDGVGADGRLPVDCAACNGIHVLIRTNRPHAAARFCASCSECALREDRFSCQCVAGLTMLGEG